MLTLTLRTFPQQTFAIYHYLAIPVWYKSSHYWFNNNFHKINRKIQEDLDKSAGKLVSPQTNLFTAYSFLLGLSRWYSWSVNDWVTLNTVNARLKETGFVHLGSEFLNKIHNFYQGKRYRLPWKGHFLHIWSEWIHLGKNVFDWKVIFMKLTCLAPKITRLKFLKVVRNLKWWVEAAWGTLFQLVITWSRNAWSE